MTWTWSRTDLVMDINLDRVKNWKLKTTIDIEHAGLQPQKLLSFILKLFLSGFHSHNPSQQKKRDLPKLSKT